MSVSRIDSSSTSGTAQAELQRAQQKLAADLAAKAADKVIDADRTAVAKSQKEVTQERQTTSTVDIDL